MSLKVLLLGEYSNVHTTLAEGLRALGHEVTVASDGDGWKDYPRDVDLRRPDGGRLATLNYYIHLWRWFREFRGYDVVQLINPVFLPLKAERIWPFYRYLRKHNRVIVLGAFGMDYYYVKACLDCHTFRYSDFNFGQTVRHYPTADAFRRDWYEGPKGRLCQHIAADCDGIVAGLYEYWASYGKEAELKDKLMFIPFPIKARPVPMSSYPAADRMGEGHPSFLIGIQRGKEEYKGTDVMLRALERVGAEMPDKGHVVKVESVPFAEYRLLLRQDNADLRLTPIGHQIGLIDEERYQRLLTKESQIAKEIDRVEHVMIGATEQVQSFLEKNGSPLLKTGLTLADLIRRPELGYELLAALDPDRPMLEREIKEQVEIQIRYDGYIQRQLRQVEKFQKMEEKKLSEDIAYDQIGGLRIEARQKLDKVKPASVGQASRIAGVTPADISVLLVYLEQNRRKA